MLYARNNEKQLDPALFKNPPSEYRGAPFWAWNCKLDKNKMLRQIDIFKTMGMGGFHMHSRTGMATEYLGRDFMDMVEACDEKAKSEGMLCWLYDEDRYSSGFAGGLVTRNVHYRQRHMIFTPQAESGFLANRELFETAVDKGEKPKGYFIAKFRVVLKNGFLHEYNRLADNEPAGPDTWYAYLELDRESPWRNNQTYVNTLDKKSIEEFVRVTHERYFKEIGSEFGKSVPAIFTDEPNFPAIRVLNYPDQKAKLTLPYTDDFDDTFRAAYGESLIGHLPELVWELPDGKISQIRYRYHDHVAERFVSAYADTIGKWCGEHGIRLTGHVLEEDSLESQSRTVGEAMRCYRSFQLPGIDMLADLRNLSTAKQAQSAVHQYGREGMTSELYGVTNWDFDFKGHKLQGDWQAALGVTVRVHHLAWASMEGEAKRDYPASISYQSPWYREYPLIENHFARLNTALTRGKPHVRVCVVHPVESCWIYWGVRSQTADRIQNLDENFQNVVSWLLYGLIDFDFICESQLPSQCKDTRSDGFQVGAMSYDAVVIPGNYTLRSTTLDRLEAFRKAGGKVIFMGEPALYVDACRSQRAQKFAENCLRVPFTRLSLLDALKPERDIDIRLDDGARSHNLFCNIREDGKKRWLFICHVNHGEKAYKQWRGEYVDADYCDNCTITIRGQWHVTLYDTLTGEIRAVPAKVSAGITTILRKMYSQDSLLLLLSPYEETRPAPSVSAAPEEHEKEQIRLEDPVDFKLCEPNVLTLDMADYALDDEPWQGREEILIIDKAVRERLGLPLRSFSSAQPWTVKGPEKYSHQLRLRFGIHSEIDVEKPLFTLEHPESVSLFLNGKKVNLTGCGFYVDPAIRTVALPSISKGDSTIELDMPFGVRTNPEWAYLLGNFGVRVAGQFSTITAPAQKLAFGDITAQGLPFYGGNVRYRCNIVSPGGRLFIQVPNFSAPLVSVSLDGQEKKDIAFAPYIADLGKIQAGKHALEITSYGNRVNTFGPIHNNIKILRKFGPKAWRPEGNAYSYPYCLKPQGVLQAPNLWIEI